MPTQNPILIKRYRFFTSARVILEDELFLKLLKNPHYSYITAISHHTLKVPTGVKAKHKKTINIYLDGGIDAVFAKFNDTARNEIRKTFKLEGLEFRHNDGNWEEMYALYRRFRAAKHLEQKPLSFLKPSLVFSLYWRGELISCMTCYDVFPYLRIQNIFSKLNHDDKDLRKMIGYATRRLIYEVCRYGCEHGYRLVDLASANFTDPKKAGITAFKSSFGGVVEDEYTYTYRSGPIRLLGGLYRAVFGATLSRV